ncbi:RNA-binding protein [Paraburkholderia sp. BL10I2N1]|uniref:RNA-binding protein n=1 Tax=Paraburkholderia sp. BL10I2N1 TaxID=1938796 RepID=UPI001061736F|nr:RNA-binding protein [Paraburkholderia sp. BL10I2N1]TDN61187.1 hypothetical protein B0G77_4621 [Paraburkholderia sp. BL10I2N1]
MADLWVGSREDDASDDEIRECLIKYGFPSFDEIQRYSGTSARPAVALNFNDTTSDALRSLQPRVHDMFRKDRTIVVQVMPGREERQTERRH